jgi:hypothetical protein
LDHNTGRFGLIFFEINPLCSFWRLSLLLEFPLPLGHDCPESPTTKAISKEEDFDHVDGKRHPPEHLRRYSHRYEG